MKNARVILKKQLKDTIRNKTILIQFILLPILTMVMENTIEMDNMPKHFFVTLFSVMYIAMAPLICTAEIISEEKDNGTLRVLLMSNVKAWEYLFGVCVYVWGICMIGCVVMSVVAKYNASETFLFLSALSIGIFISAVIGAAIGVISMNQMSATSLVMPVMMALSFLPMIANYNKAIAKIAKILYTQQIYSFIVGLECAKIELLQYLVIASSLIIAGTCFIAAYRKGFQ